MKIATVITGLTIGGAEQALVRTIAATRGQFDHHVISLASGGALAPAILDLDVPVTELGLRISKSPFAGYRKARAVIASFQPRVLVGQMYHGNALAALLRGASGQNLPVIWNVHYTPRNIWRDSLSTQVAFRACQMLRGTPRTIVYVSERSRALHERYGYPSGRGVLIPNGLDMTQFRFDADARHELRAAWGFEDRDFVVGHVARRAEFKDHGNMLAALQIAIDRNPHIAAVFAGPGTEDLPVPEAIRSRVRLLGPRLDVPGVMSACDIGALSSNGGEALPNVLGEFLACGRLCVATDVGDCRRQVAEFGTIVPPRDPGQLATALLDLQEMPGEQRAALGAAGRQSILARYDISSVARQHEKLWIAAAG